MRSFPLRSALAGLLALVVGAAVVTVAQATPVTRPSACAGVKALKSVFPLAGKVGFDSRSSAKPGGDMRINGICGGWYTAYGYRPHDTRGTGVSVVSVSLFRTRADALAYFASIGRPPLPPKGVGMRTEVFPETDVHGVVHQVGNVVSVVRRVVISSGAGQAACLSRERGRARTSADSSPHSDGCACVGLRSAQRSADSRSSRPWGGPGI